MTRRARVYRCRLCGWTGTRTEIAAHVFWKHRRPEALYMIYLAGRRRPGLHYIFDAAVEEGVIERYE